MSAAEALPGLLPAAAAGWRVARIAPAAADAIGPAWARLAAEALEPNIFAGPELLPPRLAAFAPAAELVTVTAADGRLALLAPLARLRLGFGLGGAMAALWSNDYAPVGTVLVDRADPEAAWAALLAELASSETALVLADQVVDGPAFAAFAAAARRLGCAWSLHDAHARAALAGGIAPAEHRARALERRRRHEYERQWRRLGERGRLEADAVTEPGAVAAAFEDFLVLEAAGWKGRAGTAMAQDPRAAAFGRRAVAAAAASGAVTVDRIRLDGRPAAVLVRFARSGRAWPWKIAYAEDLAAFSPGLQVMLQATERLLADPGFVLADSLAVAGHPMIDHLWRERVHVATVVVDLAGGLKARLGAADLDAYLALKRAARAARTRLRRELARLGR